MAWCFPVIVLFLDKSFVHLLISAINFCLFCCWTWMKIVGNWIFGNSIPVCHSRSCSILLGQRISIAIRIGVEHFYDFFCVLHCVSVPVCYYLYSLSKNAISMLVLLYIATHLLFVVCSLQSEIRLIFPDSLFNKKLKT